MDLKLTKGILHQQKDVEEDPFSSDSDSEDDSKGDDWLAA